MMDPRMMDPDEELQTRRGTLKNLIGNMNDRMARDFKGSKGVDVTVSVQPAAGEDDLEGLDPEMAELIRSKRAG